MRIRCSKVIYGGWIVFAGLLVASASDAMAQTGTIQTSEGPAPYNTDRCITFLTSLRPSFNSNRVWRSPEIETWTQLCNGHKMTKEKWQENERSSKEPFVLRSSFMRAVIASNQFDAPGYDKVGISGATVEGDLDLDRINIRFPLLLSDMVFQDEVSFEDASTNHNISILKSEFKKGVSFWRFQSSQSLKLTGRLTESASDEFSKGGWDQKHNKIRLDLARVEGAVTVEDFHGVAFSAVSARVGQHFSLARSRFRDEVSFQTASASQIDVVEVKLPDEDQSINALPDRTNTLDGARRVCEESLIMEEVRVTLSIYISGSVFFCGIEAKAMQIGGSVNLLGLDVGDIDLTGSRIGGDLHIGPRQPAADRLPLAFTWRKGARIVLSNANVNMVRAAFDDWPGNAKPQDRNFKSPCRISPEQQAVLKQADRDTAKTDLEYIFSFLLEIANVFKIHNAGTGKTILVNGFSFNGFATPESCFIPKFAEAPVFNVPENGHFSAYQVEQWLKNVGFSSSIFEVLARQARESGADDIARRIKLIEKYLEHDQASIMRWLILTASRWTTGYGYYNGIAGIWAFLIWCVGCIVAQQARTKKGNIVLRSDPSKVVDISPMLFSVDLLLPIVRLNERNYEVEIKSKFERRWFYMHKCLGFVIGGFLFGGLAGVGH